MMTSKEVALILKITHFETRSMHIIMQEKGPNEVLSISDYRPMNNYKSKIEHSQSMYGENKFLQHTFIE